MVLPGFFCALPPAEACARKSAAGLHKKALPDRAGRLEAAPGRREGPRQAAVPRLARVERRGIFFV